MAKDRTSVERAEKKEKKHKEKHTDDSGKVKKDKKEKKSRKSVGGDEPSEIGEAEVTTKLLNTLEKVKPGSVTVDDKGVAVVKVVDDDKDNDAMDVDGPEDNKQLSKEQLVGAMVPFANPLADEKTMRKVLKGVKKGM